MSRIKIAILVIAGLFFTIGMAFNSPIESFAIYVPPKFTPEPFPPPGYDDPRDVGGRCLDVPLQIEPPRHPDCVECRKRCRAPGDECWQELSNHCDQDPRCEAYYENPEDKEAEEECNKCFEEGEPYCEILDETGNQCVECICKGRNAKECKDNGERFDPPHQYPWEREW